MNIVIADDDESIRNEFEQIVTILANNYFQNYQIKKIFATGKENWLINYVETETDHTLFFLDIVFEKEKNDELIFDSFGLTLCRMIKARNLAHKIVLITKYPEEIKYSSVKLDVVNVILKDSPNLINEIYCTMLHILENSSDKQYFSYSTSRKDFRIPVHNIFYFEKVKGKGYTTVYYLDGYYNIYLSLKNISKLIHDQNIHGLKRCHQSFIVNTDRIIAKRDKQYILLGSRECPYSRFYLFLEERFREPIHDKIFRSSI